MDKETALDILYNIDSEKINVKDKIRAIDDYLNSTYHIPIYCLDSIISFLIYTSIDILLNDKEK